MPAARVKPLTQTRPYNNNNFKRRFSRPSAYEKANQDSSTSNVKEFPNYKRVKPKSRILHYFRWLSEYSDTDIDLLHLRLLIKEGADPSAHDEESGFSVLHNVAAQWDVAVADFLVSQGAKVDCVDHGGRTPLHIAAYANHTDMVEYLLNQGADPDNRTVTEQTTVHYAVRGDSTASLKLLINRGAQYDDLFDSRGRTPLQLAAELDCDNAVSFLLSVHARPDVADRMGHPAIVSMIHTMPHMVGLALDQFHRIYPSERSQEYDLDRIETDMCSTKTPFETTVELDAYRVLIHPVMRKLVEKKWKVFARWYFLIHFGLYILFVLVWTTLHLHPPIQSKHKYNYPTDFWRVILGVIGLILLGGQIGEEVIEYILSHSRNKRYKDWLKARLADDIAACPSEPLFNSERNYLKNSLHETKKLKTQYFSDSWNYIDVITFVLLISEIFLHLFDVAFHTEALALWVARMGGLGIILVWVRLLKYARASELLGPMVAIISQLSENIIQYILIVSVIYIPYAVNFWVMFGGEQQTAANLTDPSPDLFHFHRVAVMLFRMSLIDSYPYEALREIDELTSTIYVISFLLITAIIGLNLFIALLSDTFKRVYDNAKANAEMQKAQLILSLQEIFGKGGKRKFQSYILVHCSPLRDHYDDDGGADTTDISQTKITHQTHRLFQHLLSKMEESYNSQMAELEATVTAQNAKVNAQIQKIQGLLRSLGPESHVMMGRPQQLPKIGTPINNTTDEVSQSNDISYHKLPYPLRETSKNSSANSSLTPNQEVPRKANRKLYQHTNSSSIYHGHRRFRQTSSFDDMEMNHSDVLADL